MHEPNVAISQFSNEDATSRVCQRHNHYDSEGLLQIYLDIK